MSLKEVLQIEAADPTAYTRGQGLATLAGVPFITVEHGSDRIVTVSADVKAPGETAYRAEVGIDLLAEDVYIYDCECPAYSKYDGMCKHCIALALRYMNGGSYYTDRSRAMTAAASGKSGGASGGKSGGSSYSSASYSSPSYSSWPYSSGSVFTSHLTPPKPRPPVTSTQIKTAVQALTADKVSAAAASQHARDQLVDKPAEPVELLATLACTRSSYYYYRTTSTRVLKLKVRRGKTSYVVKNMSSLVQAYETGAELSYGKNLTFVHTPAAFTERAQALMGIVARIVHSQQALFMSRDRYWDAGRGTDIKELPLSSVDLIEILDTLQGTSLAFEPTPPSGSYTFSQPQRTVEAVEGDPEIEAVIASNPKGGYDLQLPSQLECFTSGKRLYLVDKDKAWKCSEEFAAQAATLFDAILPVEGEGLHIAEEDLGDFCRTVLPVLRARTTLKVPEDVNKLVPPDPEFHFSIGLEGGDVFCRATVAYADKTVGLFEPARSGQPSRDLAREYQAQDVVDAYFPGGTETLPSFEEGDDERLYLLLTEGLRELSTFGEVMLSERLSSVAVRESPQVKISAAVRSGLLDIEVSSSELSAADLAAYLASYKRKQRYLRLSDGDIIRLDGSVRALNDLAEGLGVDAEELVKGVGNLPSNRTLYVDALLKKASGVRLDRNDGFRAIVRDFDTFSDADFEVPASLADVLRPYQDEGFRWLETLERFGFGGILADDMGLGKTLQMIAHILARKEAGDKGPTLIVAPASLVYNWMAELERFAPQLDAVAVLGTKAQRGLIIASSAEHDVLVTSYDLMKRDVEAYTKQTYARAVLDEAQYIKTPTTQAAKAAKCLPAHVRFALTGTPMENRVAELWSIFDYLMPGLLGTRDSFSKRVEGPVANREEGAAERLRCMVSPFILRRLKGDVLAELPEKNESVVYARMVGEQDKLYKANQDRLAMQISHELPAEFKKNKLQVLAELTKLRQICCDPHLYYENYEGGSAKLETCMELMKNALDAGHKILLFSQFTTMLDIVAKRLTAEKVRWFMLTGSTSKEERARLVEAFQAGQAPVFLISLKAGGVGLNLTAADVVIHYDPWWNIAAQNQATDRAHRIGQTRDVSVFKLIVKDTIEERIVKLQESKRDLAESVLGGEGIGSSSLSKEDIMALLGAQEG